MARIELKAYSKSTGVPISITKTAPPPNRDLLLSPRAFLPTLALLIFAAANGSAAYQGGAGQVAQAPDKPTVIEADYGADESGAPVPTSVADTVSSEDINTNSRASRRSASSQTPSTRAPAAHSTPSESSDNQASPLVSTVERLADSASRLSPL